MIDLPELLPSESKIANWLKGSLWQLQRYIGTLALALTDPVRLIRHLIRVPSIWRIRAQVAPVQFVVLSLFIGSYIGLGVNALVAESVPFFRSLGYYSGLVADARAFAALEKHLHGVLDVFTFLLGVEFELVIMPVALWFWFLSGRTMRYWTAVAVLQYLLPVFFLADLIEGIAVNLLHRFETDSPVRFVVAGSIVFVLIKIAVCIFFFVVVTSVCLRKGWTRLIYAIGFFITAPLLLIYSQAAIALGPAWLNIYRTAVAYQAGRDKLAAGDLSRAGELLQSAVDIDTTGYWSVGARILLVTVEAQRLKNLLAGISADSGIRERLILRLASAEPLATIAGLWRPTGTINANSQQLYNFRDEILDDHITGRDIPVTQSELDCALGKQSPYQGCYKLQKGDIGNEGNPIVQTQKELYLVYRGGSLMQEPSVAERRRYLEFLIGLPFRLEFNELEYHAINLQRESETLAHLDDIARLGLSGGDDLVAGNRKIRNSGAKYPYLNIADSRLENMSRREFEFLLRQTYLNYLRAEAKALENSQVTAESSVLRKSVEAINKDLDLIANEATYREIPPSDFPDEMIGSPSRR